MWRRKDSRETEHAAGNKQKKNLLLQQQAIHEKEAKHMRIVDNGYGWEIRAFGVEVIEFAAYDEAYEYYMAHKQPPARSSNHTIQWIAS